MYRFLVTEEGFRGSFIPAKGCQRRRVRIAHYRSSKEFDAMVRVNLPISSLRDCRVGVVDLFVIESAEHFLICNVTDRLWHGICIDRAVELMKEFQRSKMSTFWKLD